MSLITQAISNAYCTTMAHNSGLSGNIARMSLLRGARTMNPGALMATDTKLTQQRINDDLTQKIADEMLGKNKKERLRGFDTFA